MDLEKNAFLRGPAYRYIRETDKMPAGDAVRYLDDDKIVAKVKLFDPTGGWTWYLAGYDADERHAFALVDGFEMEDGDVDMAELTTTRVRFGLGIERDLHWSPKTFAAIRAERRR